MRRSHQPAAALLVAAGLLYCAPATPAPGSDGSSTVLLELFTSQGCSSCPPADRLLSELGSDPDLATRVFPLSFHVDSWNRLGWTDPFSSEAWSERQRLYARAWDEDRVYTPQLVVDGRQHAVGSRRDEVHELVRQALERPDAAKLAVRISPGETPADLRATVTAEVLRTPDGVAGPLDLRVALYENDLVTEVERGENASRTLRHDSVVRRLADAGELPVRAGASETTEVAFALDPSWKVRDLGIVAFVQDRETRAVLGAARATLAVIE